MTVSWQCAFYACLIYPELLMIMIMTMFWNIMITIMIDHGRLHDLWGCIYAWEVVGSVNLR